MKLYAKPGFAWAESGLVGLWCPVLSGSTGSTLLDCNPSTSNHGTLTGYTDINAGWMGTPYGTAIGFLDTNDGVVCPRNPLRNSTNFSVSVWCIRDPELTANSQQQIVANQFYSPGFTGFSFGYNNLLLYNLNANSFLVYASNNSQGQNSGWTSPANSFPVGTQMHCIMNFITGLPVEFIINGRKVVTTPWGYTNYNLVSWETVERGLGIGINSQSYLKNSFIGKIQEVRTYYNRILSEGEAMQEFTAGPGGMWQLQPRRPRSYFAQVLSLVNRRRSSRYLCFPG